MKAVLATNNKHKIKELSEVLEGFFDEILTIGQLGIDVDIDETGASFKENAFIKAEYICKTTGLAALADDSGLCVDALGGEPGIYSARYSGCGDSGNNSLLLKKLSGISNRQAQFVCCIALVLPDGETIYADGVLNGSIAYEPAGVNGFGYDPLFIPDGYKETMAQLSPQVKNKISHRAIAVMELKRKLEGLK